MFRYPLLRLIGHHGDKGLLHPSWACLLAHEGLKKEKNDSPVEGNVNLLRGGGELEETRTERLTTVIQALLFC